MSRSSINQYTPDVVSIPGETLLEILNERGISQSELAGRTGRPKKTINEIIRGKAALTPETALQLERALGIPAAFWNNLERNFRENQARIAEHRSLEAQVDWMRRLPVRAMVEKGWIKKCSDKVEQLRELLNFFGVASPSCWDELIGAAAFRKSAAFEVDEWALAVWLRKGEIEGRAATCRPFNRRGLRKVLDRSRKLTMLPLNEAFPVLGAMCAEVGVATVIVPELPKTRVNGATRWLSKEKALVQLSVRHKKEDVFWFSFFHEAAHILLHGKREVFVDTDKHEGRFEEEADKLAGDLLIPGPEYRRFASRTHFRKTSITEFAGSVDIDPGIVVGRLQHDRKIGFETLNGLRRPIDAGTLPLGAMG